LTFANQKQIGSTDFSALYKFCIFYKTYTILNPSFNFFGFLETKAKVN